MQMQPVHLRSRMQVRRIAQSVQLRPFLQVRGGLQLREVK